MPPLIASIKLKKDTIRYSDFPLSLATFNVLASWTHLDCKSKTPVALSVERSHCVYWKSHHPFPCWAEAVWFPRWQAIYHSPPAINNWLGRLDSAQCRSARFKDLECSLCQNLVTSGSPSFLISGTYPLFPSYQRGRKKWADGKTTGWLCSCQCS